MGRRLPIIAALVGLFLVTWAVGIANVLRASPELALRVAPWHAGAAGRFSQQLLVEGTAHYARAEKLAQQALARDPTVIAAVVTLGTIAEARGQSAAARQRFEYAIRLSRRDLPTQLWWIERAVADENVPAALYHYDTALRAIPQAPDLLFPIMGSAISEPEIRTTLATMLRADTPWRDRFLEWLVTNGVDNRSASSILANLWTARRPIKPELYGRLEQGLIEQGDFETAWALYRQRHPNAFKAASRDQNFAAFAAGNRSPFDWQTPTEDGVAFISPSDGRYALTFATVPASSSVLVRQFMQLPPSRYRLHVDASVDSGAAEGLPYWSLRCVDDRELGRSRLSPTDAALLTVPTGCAAQWLILRNDANDMVEPASGVVRSVRLVREGR